MEDNYKAQLQHLLDRQAIMDCLYRYTRGVDRLDRELLLSAYHPDAIDDHGAFVGGPVAFVEFAFPRHRRDQQCTNHLLMNHQCEIEGNVAHAETLCLYIGVNRSGTTDVVGCRYVDRLERREGEWKIFRRVCVTDWFGGLHGESHFDPSLRAVVEQLQANAHTARDRSDISYCRPLEITRTARP